MAVKPVFHISFRQEHHKNRQNLAGTYSEGYFHRTERSPPFSPSSPPPFKLSLVPKDLFPSCPAPSFILFPILHGGSPYKIPLFPKPPRTLYFRRSFRPPESEPSLYVEPLPRMLPSSFRTSGSTASLPIVQRVPFFPFPTGFPTQGLHSLSHFTRAFSSCREDGFPE